MRRAAGAARRPAKRPEMIRTRSILIIGLILLSVSLTCYPELLRFHEGSADCGWDGEGFLIAVRLNTPYDQAGTWVLTLIADRFADGIFAWQLHSSASFESVLVIPNDFLTIRNFLPEALGIGITRSEQVGTFGIRIPKEGPLPNLVAPGDEIRIHALWIKSAPLVGFTVPESGEAPAGGGGSAESKPGTDPLPAGDVFTRGEMIENSFVLIDPETGEPRMYVAASYSLLRMREGEADEFLRFAQIEQDPETGVFSYEIDTTRLTPGKYRLIVAVGTKDERYEKTLEIVDSEG